MLFFENGEQPELTGKDLQEILTEIEVATSQAIAPYTYLVENAERETRLKFNSPTEVVSFDLIVTWGEPSVRKIRAHVLYWETDKYWEVVDTIDL